MVDEKRDIKAEVKADDRDFSLAMDRVVGKLGETEAATKALGKSTDDLSGKVDGNSESLRKNTDALDRHAKATENAAGGMHLIAIAIGAIAGFGPALTPIAAYLTGPILAAIPAIMSLGPGLLGAGLALKTTFSSASAYATKLQQDQAKITNAVNQKSRDTALVQYQHDLQNIPAASRPAVVAIQQMKDNMTAFSNSFRPQTLALISKIGPFMVSALNAIKPATAGVLSGLTTLMDTMRKGLFGGSQNKSMWAEFGPMAKAQIIGFGDALTHLIHGLMEMSITLKPLLYDIMGTTESIAAHFDKTMGPGGRGTKDLTSFVKYVERASGPVEQFFRTFRQAFMVLAKGIFGGSEKSQLQTLNALGGVLLTLAESLAKFKGLISGTQWALREFGTLLAYGQKKAPGFTNSLLAIGVSAFGVFKAINALHGAVTTITGAWGKAAELMGKAHGLFTNIVSVSSKMWGALGKAASAVSDFGMKTWIAASNAAKGMAESAIGVVKSIATMVVGWVSAAATSIASAAAVAAAWIAANAAFLLGVGAVIIAVVIIIKYHKQIWEFVKKVWNDIWHFIKKVGEDIWHAVKAAWDMLFKIVKTVGKAVLEWVTGYWIVQLIQSHEKMIARWLDDVLKWGEQMLTNLVNGFVAVFNWFKNLGTTILGYIGDAETWLVSVGQDLLKGLWNGVTGFLSWLKQKIGGLGHSVVNFFKSALGIASPSKKTMEHGRYLIEGLVKGMLDNQGLIDKAVKKISSRIVFTPQMAGIGGNMLNYGGGLKVPGMASIPTRSTGTSYYQGGASIGPITLVTQPLTAAQVSNELQWLLTAHKMT